MFSRTYPEINMCLASLLEQLHEQYIFGQEQGNIDDPNAKAWDCSELVERAFRDKLLIQIPDGARYQRTFCAQNGVPINYPVQKVQPLDLVFLYNRDEEVVGHVAVVLGEMVPVGGAMLIEARGKPYNRVVLMPLDRFLKDFEKRIAGIYRIVEARP